MSEGEQAVGLDEWENDYGRNPFENLRRLVEETPDEVPDGVLVDIATRSIAGMGSETARRALERIRDESE